MTRDQQERLKPLLAKLYWAAAEPREFRLVTLIFLACGFKDPLHYGMETAIT